MRPAARGLAVLGLLALSIAGCEADRPRPAGGTAAGDGSGAAVGTAQQPAAPADAVRQPVASPSGTEARPPVRLDELRPGASTPPGDSTRGSVGPTIEAPAPWRTAPGGSRRF
jgi:hypothetical protein